MKNKVLFIFLIMSNFYFAQNRIIGFDFEEFSSNENLIYASIDSNYYYLDKLDSSNINEISVIIDSLLNVEKSKGIHNLEIRDYNFQIVPYTVKNGNKKVWINGLSKKFDLEWHQKIIRPKGAGHKVLTICYNLSTNKVEYYYFNSLY